MSSSVSSRRGVRTLKRLLQNRPGDDDLDPILADLGRDRELLKMVAKEASTPRPDEHASAADRERLLDLVAALVNRKQLLDTRGVLERAAWTRRGFVVRVLGSGPAAERMAQKART